MRSLFTLLSILAILHASAQNVHQIVMTGSEFLPDTVMLAPGDSIHVTFEIEGHSMIQVPEDSWLNGIAAPMIGIALGTGTPNPGFFHEFVMDSTGTFYYLCEQHPNERGVIMVDEGFITSIKEQRLPGFSLYPQPASDQVYFDGVEPFASLMVVDHQGRSIQAHTQMDQRGLDVSQLPTGIYFITILDASGAPVAREKMVVSR